MTVVIKRRPTHETLSQLPSLPQVLLRLLNAVSQDTADYQHLADIIRQDAATAARLLNIANSSLYNPHRRCDSIERALMTLGIETVRTLVVTAAVKQYFSQFSPRQFRFMQMFWQRSLMAAQSAQVIATLTRYHSPMEAYVAGLLMDIGQLCLLAESPEEFLAISAPDARQALTEEAGVFGITHCDLGAELIASWQLDSFAADAVRYHHAGIEDISQAHHLVKIVNLANELSAPEGLASAALSRADQLFGLNEELVAELYSRILADVDKVSSALGVDQEHDSLQAQVGEKISDLHQRQSISLTLQASGQNEGVEPDLADRVSTALMLGFGIERYLVFLHNPQTDRLEAKSRPDIEQPDFVINDADKHCLVAQVHQSGQALDTGSTDPASLSVTDQQLRGYCRSPWLLLMPFNCDAGAGNLVRGVLVAAATRDMLLQYQRKNVHWLSLLNIIAASFAASRETVDDTRIREAIHEVSNPLSVINNYLDVLRFKLDSDSDADREITILKEEIDRIGQILLRLRHPGTPAGVVQTDINEVVTDLVSIFRQSMCVPRRIDVQLDCDAQMSPVTLDRSALKQVVTNLIKNAVEAMPDGGRLSVSTQRRVLVNSRVYAAVSIEDSGPGIPDTIMGKLFEPKPSSKGDLHAGVGLSVVKKLMDAMKAQIVCSSDDAGTRFKLLFPVDINNL